MSEKRRDNRNRILRDGEYQRKDGRYRYRYVDENGKEQSVYSWRLDKNDPMPKVTPPVCRHTFCSNMAKSGMNPKTLQYIMGHADISVTLNTYNHVSYEDAKGELLRLAHAWNGSLKHEKK